MRSLLIVVAAVLFALGWLAGQVATGAIWCWSALAVGWDAARYPAETAAPAEMRRVA